MPSWNELLDDFNAAPEDQKSGWLDSRMNAALSVVGALRRTDAEPRNVVLYGSAFLQKAQVPGEHLMITHEDLNGFMSVIYGMDWDRGLTLLLHTPGGVTNAAETLVAYLRSKFTDFEVIVPTYAMSAGTMIALASDRIVMGRQSQLGPIDPQMGLGGGRTVSARAIVEQFERARTDILNNTATAHVWAPIIQSLGPALVQEAQNVLDYSEKMVSNWLTDGMFAALPNKRRKANAVARHFNDASKHKSHGRRIGRDEASAQGVNIEELEDSQALQEAVLTAYHLMTIMFEQSGSTKVLWSHNDRKWLKNFQKS